MLNRIERILAASKRRDFEKQHGHKVVEKKEVPTKVDLALELGKGPEGAQAEREFPLAEVLTVLTGALFVPKTEFGKVADLLEYMEGASLLRDAKTAKDALNILSRAADNCKEWMVSQHEWLKKVKVPKDTESIRGWMEVLKQSHGETIKLKPKPMSKVGWTPPSEIFWEEPSK